MLNTCHCAPLRQKVFSREVVGQNYSDQGHSLKDFVQKQEAMAPKELFIYLLLFVII